MNKANQAVVRAMRLSPLILLILMIGVIMMLNSSVLTGGNIVQIVIQSAPIIILAFSVMVWLISGGMDMSIAYGTAFYVMVFGNILQSSNSLVLALLAVFGSAIAVGLFNGFFIGVFEMPPFIVTLGSMSILQGLILEVASSSAIIIDHPVMKFIGMGKVLGVPTILICAAVIALVIWWMMKYTRFGTNTYALGSNVEAARVNGVNIAVQQMKIYLFSAVMTALAAVILAARVSLVSPTIGGINFLLNAVTATIIGGTSFSGGKGNVLGTIAGGIIIGVINFSMTAFGVSTASRDMAAGLIVIIALCLDALFNRIRASVDA